ncbi:MAG: hypothetical protein IJP23_05510, partial [Oscillospiraceae bacterium]|nr:hypothetical protein [Oscillospiraceae bacterium]
SLVVVVREADGEKACTAFSAIEGVEAVEAVPSNTASGETVINLKVSRGCDIRSRVWEAASGAGLTLLTLRPAEISLEDVFLELTGGENAQKEADE